MYIYYRQSYRNLKPAAVFPIEVELNYLIKDSLKPTDGSPTNVPAKDLKITGSEGQTSEETEDSSTLTPVDNLLLDLGVKSQDDASTGVATEDHASGTLPPIDDLLLGLGDRSQDSATSNFAASKDHVSETFPPADDLLLGLGVNCTTFSQ